MNKNHKRKLFTILTVLSVIAVAAGLVLYALKQNINLFYTPSQLLTATSPHKTVRLGGYVKKHSLVYSENADTVSFTVTDMQQELTVHYHGVLPNLFREGQGVVVTGALVTGHDFNATQVLAKHDEKYIPRAFSNMLPKQQGKTS